MATITLVHDCDVERRATPNAVNGDFRDCYLDGDTVTGHERTHDGSLIQIGVVVPGGKGSEYERRGLFRYDLRAFIPADASITAAVWHIYVSQTDLSGLQSIRAIRIRRNDDAGDNAWEEDHATWDCFRLYDSGTATGGSSTTLEDSGASWPGSNGLAGYGVRTFTASAYQWRSIASNTGTELTISGPNWTDPTDDPYIIREKWATAGAGDNSLDRDPTTPGTVGLGVISTTGWKALTGDSPYILGLVDDAWDNRDGICSFIAERYTELGNAGLLVLHGKAPPGDPTTNYHHLRVTYTLGGKTFQAFVFDSAIAAAAARRRWAGGVF